jgi:hypothetical protein
MGFEGKMCEGDDVVLLERFFFFVRGRSRVLCDLLVLIDFDFFHATFLKDIAPLEVLCAYFALKKRKACLLCRH